MRMSVQRLPPPQKKSEPVNVSNMHMHLEIFSAILPPTCEYEPQLVTCHECCGVTGAENIFVRTAEAVEYAQEKQAAEDSREHPTVDAV